MSPRRLAFWLLASSGVAVGHIAGYAIAHPDNTAREVALGGHAYLPITASVVVPVGLVAALGWAVHTARGLGLAGQVRARELAAAQIGLFLLQEFVERAVVGEGAGATFAERGVWVGLVAQIAIAYLVARAINIVHRVVRGIVRAGRITTVAPRLSPLQLSPARKVVPPATVAVGLRAPPDGCQSH